MENKSVAILLATYNPREDWLIELLDSLNAQTYPNLHLYVRDDASPRYSFERLQEVVKEHVTKIPYSIVQSEKNAGSNETFSALVRDAQNEHYISFCDQDDVWLPCKVENTVRLFEESPLHPTLVCTNVSIIDGDGKDISPAIDVHRPHHKFIRGGTAVAGELIYRNFIIGCTMLMERERALAYLPVPKSIVHDHYLGFRAAADGAVDYLPDAQMKYRIYGGNQTGIMMGVESKADYLVRRIYDFRERVEHFSENVDIPELEVARQWCDAREKNFKREKGGFSALWKMRNVNKSTSYFELFGLRFPNFLFRFAIHQIRKGKI